MEKKKVKNKKRDEIEFWIRKKTMDERKVAKRETESSEEIKLRRTSSSTN